ncbi:MAG: hypothetical protein EOP00_21265 [Pedobacter sp.]|nr:MAG: hypothetical protein EOP00_21265 [Pedobacter sp.]
MQILPHTGNIFDLLLGDCDGIIVWAKGGFTCIGTDWKIFRKKISEDDDKFTRIGSPWKTHHSIPLFVRVNNERKYVYFLRNELEADTISDSRLVLQLTAAIKTLKLLGCESIAFNGVRSTEYVPGLPTDSMEVKAQKQLHNKTVNRERVDLIVDTLYSFNTQAPVNLSVHLISKNDVFTRSILSPINI